jgi:hypothetical protein
VPGASPTSVPVLVTVPLLTARSRESEMTIEDGWKEQYDCYRKVFGGTFVVNVSWSNDRERPGYVVTAAGRTLTQNSPTSEDGKRRGVDNCTRKR